MEYFNIEQVVAARRVLDRPYKIINVNTILECFDALSQNSKDCIALVIIINKDTHRAQGLKRFCNNSQMHPFPVLAIIEDEFAINPVTHSLNRFVGLTTCNNNNIPLMLKTDPLARWLGLIPGDIAEFSDGTLRQVI